MFVQEMCGSVPQGSVLSKTASLFFRFKSFSEKNYVDSSDYKKKFATAQPGTDFCYWKRLYRKLLKMNFLRVLKNVLSLNAIRSLLYTKYTNLYKITWHIVI